MYKTILEELDLYNIAELNGKVNINNHMLKVHKTSSMYLYLIAP